MNADLPETYRCLQCGRWYNDEPASCPIDGAPLEAIPSLVGQLIAGRYQIIEVLAKGGMSVVYLARQPILDRLVALKVMAPRRGESSSQPADLLEEARSVSRMRHPNIVTLFDFGELPDGRLFIAFEYVRGSSLAHTLVAGPMPVRKALEFGIQLAAALAEAHRLGIIHRDVKPANVMVTESSSGQQVRLLDFGIAHHLNQSRSDRSELGTAAYSAPETFARAPIDQRTDIYALGVMLFEMLTGARPYTGTSERLAHRHTTSPIPVAGDVRDMPTKISQLIAEMMAKRPEDRPASAHQVEVELKEIVASLGTDSVTPSWGVPAIESSRIPDQPPKDREPLVPLGGRPSLNRFKKNEKQPVRWSYIVLLGLVSAAAIGVVSLQESADQAVGERFERGATRFMPNANPAHRVEVPSFIQIDARLRRASRSALVPNLTSELALEPKGQLEPPYGALLGVAPPTNRTLESVRNEIENEKAKLASADDDEQRLRAKLALVVLIWDEANLTTVSDTVNYGAVIKQLGDVLSHSSRIPALDTVLYYLAYAYRMQGSVDKALPLERRIMDHHAGSPFARKVRIRMLQSALAANRVSLASSIRDDLSGSNDPEDKRWASFFKPYISYARHDFATALDQALTFVETSLGGGEEMVPFQVDMTELLVLAGARTDDGSLLIRGYLRGLGGPSFESRYLPLLGVGLLAARDWRAAEAIFFGLASLSPEMSSIHEWRLDHAAALYGLQAYDRLLQIFDDSLAQCTVKFSSEERRAFCQLLLSRTKIHVGAEEEAAKILEQLEGRDSRLFEVKMRLIDLRLIKTLSGASPIQESADELRAELAEYAKLSESADLFWQAVLWGRQAQASAMFARRLRSSSRFATAAGKWQTKANAAALRSAAAWSSSGEGLDRYIELGALGW